MTKKIKIGVIFGGRSGEHEVSLASATSIINSLNKKKYQIIPIGITRRGEWIASGDPMKALKSGKMSHSKKAELIIPSKNGYFLKAGTKKIKVDVVFPVLHGTYGEDGSIQGLFEMARIPYIGANILGSSVGMDKVVQKQLYENIGLSVSNYFWFLKNDWKSNKEQANILRHIEKTLEYPLFVKPANLGSSVGINKARNKKELIKAINIALKYDEKVLVEEGVKNPREIECAVLGNREVDSSIPGEIISSGDFYDYSAKYIDGKSEMVIPVELPVAQRKKIQGLAIKAYKAINCLGMGRVDFLLDNKTKKVYINEINTIPGFTVFSMYPKLWEASGLSYSKLLDKLIKLAFENFKEKEALSTSYK